MKKIKSTSCFGDPAPWGTLGARYVSVCTIIGFGGRALVVFLSCRLNYHFRHSRHLRLLSATFEGNWQIPLCPKYSPWNQTFLGFCDSIFIYPIFSLKSVLPWTKGVFWGMSRLYETSFRFKSEHGLYGGRTGDFLHPPLKKKQWFVVLNDINTQSIHRQSPQLQIKSRLWQLFS